MINSIPKEWHIIIVDGRFTGSKAKEQYSSKYLRDKVKLYTNVTLLDGLGLEVDNRNRYLEASQSFDILITIDSDEWIGRFNPELFYNYVGNLKSGMHMLEFGDTNKSGCRLYVKPFEWRYYKSHKYLKHKGETIKINSPESIVNGIELLTNEDLRSDELKNTINEYQKQLWKYEDTLNFDN